MGFNEYFSKYSIFRLVSLHIFYHPVFLRHIVFDILLESGYFMGFIEYFLKYSIFSLENLSIFWYHPFYMILFGMFSLISCRNLVFLKKLSYPIKDRIKYPNRGPIWGSPNPKIDTLFEDLLGVNWDQNVFKKIPYFNVVTFRPLQRLVGSCF